MIDHLVDGLLLPPHLTKEIKRGIKNGVINLTINPAALPELKKYKIIEEKNMENNFRDLMKTFRIKRRALEEEIANSKNYQKFIQKKITRLIEEEDAAIQGVKNFDEDQLSIFDLGAVKNEFEQGGELDQEDDQEPAGEPVDEGMDDADDLDIEDPDDDEEIEPGADAEEDDGPIEFDDDEEDTDAQAVPGSAEPAAIR